MPVFIKMPAGNVFPWALATSDLDGDGRGDLVVLDNGKNTLHVAKGKNQASGNGVYFGSWSTQPTGAGPRDLGLADMNGNGDLDAVLLVDLSTSPSGLAVHLGAGNATFGPPLLSTALDTTGEELVLGDLTGDGVPDALVLEPHGGDETLRLWTGAVNASFTAGLPVPLGQGGSSVALGDCDADGDLDVAALRADACAPDGGELLVFAGDGAGGLGVPQAAAQSVQVTEAVVTADFDADGDADLATLCRLGGSVALFLSDGAGGFGAPVTGGTPHVQAGSLIVADVDDDGALDLAHGGGTEYVMQVVRGDGAGGLHSGSAHPSSTGGFVRGLVALDLNLDGQTDLVQLGSSDGDAAQHVRQQGAANAWSSIGGGIAGAAGQPRLLGSGEPVAGQVIGLHAEHLVPGAQVLLVVGLELLDQPFKGGSLVPTLDRLVPLPSAGVNGSVNLSVTWPSGLPSDWELWLQAFSPDALAVHGMAATGGVRLQVP